MAADSQDPTKELAAMKTIATALSELDASAVNRVLLWAMDVYRSPGSPNTNTSAGFGYGMSGGYGKAGGYGLGVSQGAKLDPKNRFGSLAEFYAAASPQQEYDKALVVGYWIQFVEGEDDFDAQSVNTELKNLGHGVGNITSAFDSLMGRRPQLVIQTKKSGTTRQARKKYRITLEGQRSVERMIVQDSE